MNYVWTKASIVSCKSHSLVREIHSGTWFVHRLHDFPHLMDGGYVDKSLGVLPMDNFRSRKLVFKQRSIRLFIRVWHDYSLSVAARNCSCMGKNRKWWWLHRGSHILLLPGRCYSVAHQQGSRKLGLCDCDYVHRHIRLGREHKNSGKGSQTYVGAGSSKELKIRQATKHVKAPEIPALLVYLNLETLIIWHIHIFIL